MILNNIINEETKTDEDDELLSIYYIIIARGVPHASPIHNGISNDTKLTIKMFIL